MTRPLLSINTGRGNLAVYTRQLKEGLTKAQIASLFGTIAGAVGAAAEAQVREYPIPSRKPLPRFYTRTEAFGRPTRPYQSKFKSDKQAFYVMKLGERGLIPYKRTGTLGRSISSRVNQTSAMTWTIAVGTNIPYANKVIGDGDTQSHYHQGTWTPLTEAVTKPAAIQTYNAIVSDRLRAAVRNLLSS